MSIIQCSVTIRHLHGYTPGYQWLYPYPYPYPPYTHTHTVGMGHVGMGVELALVHILGLDLFKQEDQE
jgi:hypothetical protein